jgi:hypothetical protein
MTVELIDTEQDVIDVYEEVLSGKRRRFPNKFFTGEEGKRRAAIVTRNLIEEKLKIPKERIPQQMHKRILYENGLTWMLGSCFDWSPFKVIENAYPGVFRKWQFNVKGMWQGPERLKLAAEATRWMIEEKERCPVDEIPSRITAETFSKYNLRGMLSVCFRGSFYKAIENAYPGRFHPWEFRNVPKNFWQGPQGLYNARLATRWLVEEKLGLEPHEIYQEVTYHLFRQFGLGGMLTGCFKGSSIAALQNAYPDITPPENPKKKPRKRKGKIELVRYRGPGEA